VSVCNIYCVCLCVCVFVCVRVCVINICFENRYSTHAYYSLCLSPSLSPCLSHTHIQYNQSWPNFCCKIFSCQLSVHDIPNPKKLCTPEHTFPMYICGYDIRFVLQKPYYLIRSNCQLNICEFVYHLTFTYIDEFVQIFWRALLRVYSYMFSLPHRCLCICILSCNSVLTCAFT